MLIDGRNFSKLHGRWLIGATVATLAAASWTVFAGSRTGRWPGGGSTSGLALGTVAAAIFFDLTERRFKSYDVLRALRGRI